jgi:hypothetical protein
MVPQFLDAVQGRGVRGEVRGYDGGRGGTGTKEGERLEGRGERGEVTEG